MRIKIYFFSIIFFGFLLRFPGLFHDFWLDEIWSFLLVAGIKSPVQVFTTLLHDNNHHLNSLFMYVLGTALPAYWAKYRILSFISGIGILVISFFLVKKIYSSRKVAILSLLFMAASYPLVRYSSEARGYSLVLFFSLTSLYLLMEYFSKRKPWIIVLYCISFVMGFLSHMQFVFTAIGLLLYTCIYLGKRPLSIRQKLLDLFYAFILPGICAFVLLSPFLFRHETGGAPVLAVPVILKDLITSLTGCPAAYYLNYLFGILVAIAVIGEISSLSKKNIEFCGFIGAMITLPAGILIFKALTGLPRFLYFRHFLVLIPFLIIALSGFLYRLLGKGGYKRILSFAAILMILCCSIARDIQFLAIGRGQYFKAFHYMYDHTPSPLITVTSNHDFRTSMMLRFYAPFFPRAKRFIYIPLSEVQKEETKWFIREDVSKKPDFQKYVILHEHLYYQFEKEFPCFDSIYWVLYRRADLFDDTKGTGAVAEGVESLNELGIIQGTAGKFDEAISLFSKAVALDPAYAESYNNLGYAYFKKGEYGRAKECFEKALEIDPEHGKAIVNLKYLYDSGRINKSSK